MVLGLIAAFLSLVTVVSERVLGDNPRPKGELEAFGDGVLALAPKRWVDEYDHLGFELAYSQVATLDYALGRQWAGLVD